MEKFPSSEELEEIRSNLAAQHSKMHEFAKQYQSREFEFIRIAVHLQDSVWKLEELIKMAKHVERNEALRAAFRK